MKTTLIIFLGLVLYGQKNLQAQTIVKEGIIWSNASCGTENFFLDSYFIKFEGEKLINDTLYKQIYRSDDELHTEWYKYGAIREDSLKRVFLYENGAEKLLYDFSLEVGDSIENDFGGLTAYVINTEIPKT